MLGGVVIVQHERLLGAAETTRYALKLIQNVVYLAVFLASITNWHLVLFFGLTCLVLSH